MLTVCAFAGGRDHPGQQHHYRGSASGYRIARFWFRTQSEDERSDLAYPGRARPLIGEFAYQIQFPDRKLLALGAMQRAERFFLALQCAAKDWISLNATKTVVYRLLGNAPRGHECPMRTKPRTKSNAILQT